MVKFITIYKAKKWIAEGKLINIMRINSYKFTASLFINNKISKPITFIT